MTSRSPGSRRGWQLLWLLLALIALGRVARLSVFMLDADATSYAVAPHLREVEGEPLKPFFPEHNCLTAYITAAEAAGAGEANIYSREHYGAEGREGPTRTAVGERFHIDSYQYPPPFLLLPWLLDALGSGFMGARSLFFFVELGLFLTCLALLARRAGAAGARASTGPGRGAVWLALPIVLGATNTLGSLQVGNVHLAVIMLAVLGMLAARRGHARTAGALLGFATVVKIFPGLLLVVLLGQRRLRPVVWTIVFALGYALATLALFGPQPFEAFFEHQLGALASGEAFSFAFEIAGPMLQNTSVQGLPFKLGTLGLLDDPAAVARPLAWAFGLALLPLAYWAGRRTRAKAGDGAALRELTLWLALLVLAQLRSPFMPWFYGSFAVLWLIALMFATHASWLARAGLLAAWLLLATPLPLPIGPLSRAFDSSASLLGTTLALGLAAWAACTAGREQYQEPPPPPTSGGW